MAPVIRVPDHVFLRLQRLGAAFVDTPATVIERLLNHHDLTTANSAAPATSRSQPSVVREGGTVVPPNVFIVPASDENLQTSLTRPVTLTAIRDRLSQSDLERLQPLLRGQPDFRCWAMTRNSRSEFDAMAPDDVVLVSTNGTGRYTHTARVVGRFESATFGRALWPRTQGLPWELVYVLRDVNPVSIPRERVNEAFGFQRGYSVRGATRVRPERVRAALEMYGTVDAMLRAVNVDAA